MPVSPKRKSHRSQSPKHKKKKRSRNDSEDKKEEENIYRKNKNDKKISTKYEIKSKKHKIKDNSLEKDQGTSHKHERRKSRSPKRPEESHRRRNKETSPMGQEEGPTKRQRKKSESPHRVKNDDNFKRWEVKREKVLPHDSSSHRNANNNNRSNNNNSNNNNSHNSNNNTSGFAVKREVQPGKEEYGEAGEDPGTPIEKQKANFERSGKLAEDTNVFKGVVIKYNEPPEARKPGKMWRLYPFKVDKALPLIHLHRQSAYLIGRDRKISEIPVDHPSCSKQHAVFQFRTVSYTKRSGQTGRQVKPYVIDLESVNGTFLNGERIKSRRYVELMEKDVLKFGFSQRKYVLLHAKTDTTEVDKEEEGDDEEDD